MSNKIILNDLVEVAEIIREREAETSEYVMSLLSEDCDSEVISCLRRMPAELIRAEIGFDRAVIESVMFGIQLGKQLAMKG